MNEKTPIENLYCVEYPANVKNDDRMIQTLGGINTISNAFSSNNSKLECRFRPEDKFCKGTNGDKKDSSNFLMKVKIKRTIVKSEDGTCNESVQCTPEVIGKVKEVFRFNNLADFQYLPIEKDETGEMVCLHDQIVPTKLEPVSWLDEPTLSYLPPASFARIDTVQPYLSSRPTDDATHLTGRTRDRRSNFVKFVSHECKEIPDIPNANTLRYLKTKLITEEQILKIKELFELRPVWTRNALSNITRINEVALKYLLALSAYHFTSGPFRISWVRFGYDPRKDPAAKKYQTVDYRIRGNVQTLLVERYPSRYAFRNKHKPWKDEKVNIEENCYVFKPGYLPPHGQMFYQLCDIHIPEIQQKLETFDDCEYDLKNGWLPEEFCDEIRKTIDKYILETLNSTQHDKTDQNDEESSDVDMNDETYNDDDFDMSDEDMDFENDDEEITDSAN
ncbi:general transcription factor 3C polypeptide 5 [Planococcus citri]|uniref:general transcription factor 3C polypeptide 5 n=1 Tax=Planococcus citri TaxID=170843 RepID=UPI0031F7A00B